VACSHKEQATLFRYELRPVIKEIAVYWRWLGRKEVVLKHVFSQQGHEIVTAARYRGIRIPVI
jgi:hypothetical protein